MQVSVSVVMVTPSTSSSSSSRDSDITPWLRRLACDNGGLVVRRPTLPRLRAMLDGYHRAWSPPSDVERAIRTDICPHLNTVRSYMVRV